MLNMVCSKIDALLSYIQSSRAHAKLIYVNEKMRELI